MEIIIVIILVLFFFGDRILDFIDWILDIFDEISFFFEKRNPKKNKGNYQATTNYVKQEIKVPVKIIIDNDCVGCGECERVCPTQAIVVDNNQLRAFCDQSKCTKCGKCVDECPIDSIKLVK